MQVFKDLYQQRIDQAGANRGSDDELNLAAELIAGAREAAASPELARLMLSAAFDLTHNVRDGYATAEKALDRLAQRFPDRAAGYSQQRVDLYERWFNATRGPQQHLVGRKFVQATTAHARRRLRPADRLRRSRDHRQAARPGPKPQTHHGPHPQLRVTT
jgi:hypothetical protein